MGLLIFLLTPRHSWPTPTLAHAQRPATAPSPASARSLGFYCYLGGSSWAIGEGRCGAAAHGRPARGLHKHRGAVLTSAPHQPDRVLAWPMHHGHPRISARQCGDSADRVHGQRPRSADLWRHRNVTRAVALNSFRYDTPSTWLAILAILGPVRMLQQRHAGVSPACARARPQASTLSGHGPPAHGAHDYQPLEAVVAPAGEQS
jgi:hypothetical protein